MNRSESSAGIPQPPIQLAAERTPGLFLADEFLSFGYWAADDRACKVRKTVLGRAAEVAVGKRAKTGLAEVKRSA